MTACERHPPPRDAAIDAGVDARYTALEIERASATVFVATSRRVYLVAHTVAGSIEPIAPEEARWTSSDDSIVEVASPGVLQGRRVGQVLIQATLLSHPWLSAELHVLCTRDESIESIDVRPAAARIPVGGTQAFQAILRRNNGTSEDATSLLSWSSSAPDIAAVVGRGMVRGIRAGAAQIDLALWGSQAQSVTVEVYGDVALNDGPSDDAAIDAAHDDVLSEDDVPAADAPTFETD